MAVESPQDLAGMFDADEFGERAQYTPLDGGSATDCLVVVDRGQGRVPFDVGKRDLAPQSERRLWVRASELAEVGRGGAFVMVDEDGVATGEAFKVAGLPKLDQLAAMWSVDLLISD